MQLVLLEIINILFWFVVILIPLVIIHEFGHLIMARLSGVRVVEFGVGIPPRVAHRKYKGIIWSLNWVLLGGFAKIYGDHDALDEAHEQAKINPTLAKKQYLENRLSELVYNHEIQFFLEDNQMIYDLSWKEFEQSKFLSSEDTKFTAQKQEEYGAKQDTLEKLISWEYDNKLDSSTAFFNKNLFQKTIIILGGVLFNLATAFTIFVVFLGFIGTPKQLISLDNQADIAQNFEIIEQEELVEVAALDTSAAGYEAGIRPGDKLVSISGQTIAELDGFDQFGDLIEDSRGQEVPVEYIEASTGDLKTKSLRLTSSGPQSKFGVRSEALGRPTVYKARSIGDAAMYSGAQTAYVLYRNFEAVWDIIVSPFTGNSEATQNVGGPVRVGEIGSEVFSSQGSKGILSIMAMISISLAAFNLLPVPALDGGRLLIIWVSTILGRRNKQLEGTIITTTMVAMLALGVLIAIKDIQGLSLG